MVAEAPQYLDERDHLMSIASGLSGVISLGLGDPDHATPTHIVAAAQTALREGLCDHRTDPAGLPELRRAIAALVGVGNRYRLLAQEPSVDPRVLQRQAAVAGRLVALVQRGQRQGALRGDVEASWVVGALASLLVLALRQMADAQVNHEQAAELVATTLLEGLATPPAKPASDR